MEPHHPCATSWRAATAVIVVAVLVSACSDSVPPPPGATARRPPFGQHRLKAPANTELPRLPEPAEVFPALTVSDPNSFRDQSDDDLVRDVRLSGGLVSIGLKPEAASRTVQSRVVPGMTRSQVLAARATLEQSGVRIVRTFRNFAALVGEIDPVAAPLIRQLPIVNYVEAELPGHLQAQDTSWGAKKIGSQFAWSDGQRGQQSYITILDGGLDLTHLASGDGPAGFYGDCYYTVTDTCYWTATAHGVMVAGVIASRDDEDGYIGVANFPTNFASIKVVNDDRSIFPNSVAAGLDWAISTGYPRHIVNMSFGFCLAASSMATAVQSAASAGILMVAAAGNTIDDDCPQPVGAGVMYPARFPEVIAVSGTDEDDGLWTAPRNPCGSVNGSRHGLYVELSAPFWAYSMAGTGGYYRDCGTSYSAAAVTGVAALAWTKYPTFTAAQLRQHLQASVVDLGPAGLDDQFGYGRIDAAKAVGYEPPPPPPPPFSVTITGTTEIPAQQACTWYAALNGSGTAPYTYAWTVDGQPAGTDSAELSYENGGNSFTLGVTVTDADGFVAIDDHSVSINPNAGCS